MPCWVSNPLRRAMWKWHRACKTLEGHDCRVRVLQSVAESLKRWNWPKSARPCTTGISCGRKICGVAAALSPWKPFFYFQSSPSPAHFFILFFIYFSFFPFQILAFSCAFFISLFFIFYFSFQSSPFPAHFFVLFFIFFIFPLSIFSLLLRIVTRLKNYLSRLTLRLKNHLSRLTLNRSIFFL